MVSTICCVAIIVFYSALLAATSELRNRRLSPGSLGSGRDLHEALQFSVAYNVWLYLAILNNVILGVRSYQFLKVHSGLRVYYLLFAVAWRFIKDFFVFVLYVTLLLGTTIIAFFQITGGNNVRQRALRPSPRAAPRGSAPAPAIDLPPIADIAMHARRGRAMRQRPAPLAPSPHLSPPCPPLPLFPPPPPLPALRARAGL